MIEIIIQGQGLDMTSWLIRSDLSDRLSSPVRAKVKSCKSWNHSDGQIRDYSTYSFPPWSIIGHNPWLTAGFIDVRGYSSVEVPSMYSTAPVNRSESKEWSVGISLPYYITWHSANCLDFLSHTHNCQKWGNIVLSE